MKGLCGLYQRVILIPRPDYASRVLLLRAMILQNGGRPNEHFDFSSLAKITDGYTPGHMHTAITAVLTERRVQQVNSFIHIRRLIIIGTTG